MIPKIKLLADQQSRDQNAKVHISGSASQYSSQISKANGPTASSAAQYQSYKIQHADHYTSHGVDEVKVVGAHKI